MDLQSLDMTGTVCLTWNPLTFCKQLAALLAGGQAIDAARFASVFINGLCGCSHLGEL
jgi:hypothetical protein